MMYDIADKYLLNHLDEAIEVVRNINDIQGGLEHLYLYDNNEFFFEKMFNSKYEVALAIAYGSYNVDDEYIKIDGYNIETYSREEYHQIIKDNIQFITDVVMKLEQDVAKECLTKRFLRVLEWN